MQDIVKILKERGDSAETLPPLTAKRPWDPELTSRINGDGQIKPVLQAALHLLNDDVTSAHNIAQAHEESMTANLTHAILHRREQDYWNSKWWLSRISHPLLKEIHGGVKGAKAFVDTVETSEKSKLSKESTQLQRKQFEELLALVKYAATECDTPLTP